jgi:RHS repeat-associated protein
MSLFPSSIATPDGGTPPLRPAPIDMGTVYTLCPFCPVTANGVSSGSNDAGLGPMAYGGGPPRTGSSDSSSASPNPPQPSLMPLGSPGPMESDSILVTGEYLQDHQLATYQSQGRPVGLQLQYSSLQADPMPVVTESLTTQPGSNSAYLSTIAVSLTVNGVSQGDPGTYDDIALTDGSTYLVQYQATNVSTLATGLYVSTLTLTKDFTGGISPVTENYAVSVMLVNLATSHYGAGWSIAGLQQIYGEVGTTNLMVTDGINAPEEFTTTDDVHYTGAAMDTSTLTYHATTATITRNYQDGSYVTFSTSGQEISSTDADGNTTTYTYVSTGPAAGALQTITDPTDQVTTLTYNASGGLSTVTDPAGRVTTFTVNSSGNLAEIVDPDGATTQYGYNSSHQMDSETDPNNATATVTYDSFGRVDSETLFDGTSTVGIHPAQSAGLLTPDALVPLPKTSDYSGSVTNPDGATTTVTYDSMGGVIQEVDGNGSVTTITRDSNDRPITVTDPMGRTTTYAYDSSGDITQITQPGGSSENLTYTDSLGVPTEIQDFNGNTTTYVLDSHGNVTEEEKPGGVDQEWTYNSAGQVLTYTDGNGHTTSFAYDSLGRMTTMTEPGTGTPTVEIGHDSAGDITSVTDEMGDTITYTYDQMGRMLTEQNPVQAGAGKETSYTYDADGNLKTVTDANGKTTTYTYNSRNELVTAEDPLGNVATYVYDAEGNVTGTIDPVGNRVTMTYDGDNNLLTAQDALGTTTYTYNADDEETSVTDANGHTTSYVYTNRGQLNTVTLPGESTTPTTYTYDNNGNLVTATDPNDHTTTYVYNALNELASETNADGDTTGYTYDNNGNVLTVTDGLSHTTSYTYDDFNRVLTETQPSGGGTTTIAYDAAGDTTSVTDPVGNVTSYTYNAAHEVATQTSPTGGVTTYTYDLVGNVTETVDPDGHEIQYGYNGDNEVTTETWVNPGGGSYNVVTYTYNGDGELAAVSDNNSAYQYTYNAEGEVTSQGDVGSPNLPTVTLTYSYDPAGNETALSDSMGGVVSYTYDARNELTNETYSNSSYPPKAAAPEAVSYTYDAAGNMTGLTRYSNLAETTVVAATSYTYDAADQMTGIVDKNSGGTTLVSYAYTYDAAGRVTQEVRDWASGSSTDTVTYGYTNNNQLTGVSHTNASFANESFAWDANGNQTGTGYTTTTGNEQTASPGYTYTYDADGNMITATDTSTGDTWTYTYDFRNRMTGAVETNSSHTVLSQVTYTYDALDNRIGLDENGTQTETLYDGSTPIMDFNGSGSLTMRYLNGPAGDLVDTVLARQSAGGTVAWYLPDRLGTIRDLIDNSGNIIDHVDYSAFGTVLGESSPSTDDRRMGFAGMERDSEVGLNLAVHRLEDPVTGRWMTLDPLGFVAGDPNLSRYVGNEPTRAADPAGTIVLPVGVVASQVFSPLASPPSPWAGDNGTPLPPYGDIIGSSDSQSGVPIWNTLTGSWNATVLDGKERGGWIYFNPKTGKYTTRAAPPGNGSHMSLANPPCIPGFVIVATWHTHPGPPGRPNPSKRDRKTAKRHGIIGIVVGGPFQDGDPIFVEPY